MLISQKKILIFILLLFFTSFDSKAEIIKKIEIQGNERIPDSTIKMLSNIEVNETINENIINEILKNLYSSNYFKDVSVSLKKNILLIVVKELPIIENISIEGIKAKKIKEAINKIISLKSRSSFNQLILLEDKKRITNLLKNTGYYFATVEIFLEELNDNKINLKYEINLGKKAKIKKITFIGNKIFKDKRLKSLIVSEEYKFWKVISGKKYLNEGTISFDERLLKNFYLNKGFKNVQINSSFAKLVDENEFELIFNIQSNDKIFFNNLTLSLPDDFNRENFLELDDLFSKVRGKPYSINTVSKIIDIIDKITVADEYSSISASVNEELNENKLNINFKIKEVPTLFVERINIFGNNITRENVIRNQLEIDEGDPFNEILQAKSVNNLKSLNFFKDVSAEVIDGSEKNTKIINFNIEEKPTGEIFAGAGFGTSGATFTFGVKENNYLGKGLGVEANATINEESFKGLFSVNNPNYNNSDKSLYTILKATETDRLSNFGYKSNLIGLELGTKFQYLKQFNFGLSGRSFYEDIQTDSSASDKQKKQSGNYWDTFTSVSFDLDKRNQKFKTTEGYRSSFTSDLPIITKTNTFTNKYVYNYYSELYENNITNFSLYLKSARSLTNDDIKLSERLYIPGRRLRGFESGKIGPKDGGDFIGGNYITSLNFSTTLPQILENSQNVDFILFLDAANVWGVDYSSTIDDGSEIRSAVGFGVDWFTPVGPLNFSISEALTKSSTDITENFRFNLGTTF